MVGSLLRLACGLLSFVTPERTRRRLPSASEDVDAEALLACLEVVVDAESLAQSLPLVRITPSQVEQWERVRRLRGQILAAASLQDLTLLKPLLEEWFRLDPQDTEVCQWIERLQARERALTREKEETSRRRHAHFRRRLMVCLLVGFGICVLVRGQIDRFVPSLWTPREAAYILGMIPEDELVAERAAHQVSPKMVDALEKHRQRRLEYERDRVTARKRCLLIHSIGWQTLFMLARTLEVEVSFHEKMQRRSVEGLRPRLGVVSETALALSIGSCAGNDEVQITCRISRPGILWGTVQEGTVSWTGPLSELAERTMLIPNVCQFRVRIDPIITPSPDSDLPRWIPRDRPRAAAWWTLLLMVPMLLMGGATALLLRQRDEAGCLVPSCPFDVGRSPLWPLVVPLAGMSGAVSGALIAWAAGNFPGWTIGVMTVWTVLCPVWWMTAASTTPTNKQNEEDILGMCLGFGGLLGSIGGVVACLHFEAHYLFRMFIWVGLFVGVIFVQLITALLAISLLGPRDKSQN